METEGMPCKVKTSEDTIPLETTGTIQVIRVKIYPMIQGGVETEMTEVDNKVIKVIEICVIGRDLIQEPEVGRDFTTLGS